MNINASTRSLLGRLHTEDPVALRTALKDVADGKAGAAEALSQKTGISDVELRAVAATAALSKNLESLFLLENELKPATTGADKPSAFTPNAGGADAGGLIALQFNDKTADVKTLKVKGDGADFSAQAQRAGPAYGVQGGPKTALSSVPTSRDILGVKSGDAKPADVAKALKAALLSANPQVVKKAARTLQIVESYQRKADQDKKNYEGTGFVPFKFPKLDLPFSKEEAAKLVSSVADTRDGATADIVGMAVRRGVLGVADSNALQKQLKAMGAGGSGQLAASDGVETPRGGAKSFHDEWIKEAEPGMRNIREAIIQTAEARGTTCPFARGNHSKGVEFGDVTMKTNDGAPDWVKDLFGSVVKGGMIRVSGSQTNPDEPDSKPHQPGIRITLPLKGSLEGGASQLFDLTANPGDTTHEDTGRKHTNFTKMNSVAGPGGLLDSTPVRVAKFLVDAASRGEARAELGAIANVLQSSNEAGGQTFNEHQFFGRHAYFMDGRYVQFRVKVLEPQDFPDPRHDKRPNARLDAVSETVAKQGMKVAMYITEIPADQPWLAEQEGWHGLPEVLAGTFEVPAQQASTDSAAHKYFDEHSFIPAGDEKVNIGIGLGRHRTVVYQESEWQRHQRRPGT